MPKTFILDQIAIQQKVTRLAYEVVEHHYNTDTIILAGIAPNGLILAKMLQQELQKICNNTVGLKEIHINKKLPQDITITPLEDFNGKTIILVDDVSMTGRTIMYALKPLLEYYPAKIQTLVLVERQQKNFPIHSDYVGVHISTTLQELIIVEANEDALTGAFLE